MTTESPPGTEKVGGPSPAADSPEQISYRQATDTSKCDTRCTTTATARRSRTDGLAAELVHHAAIGDSLPWSEFVENCHRALRPNVGPGPRTTTTSRWRAVRRAVLERLDGLDLTAVVVRSDSTVPVGEHFADVAGLVQIRGRGEESTLMDASLVLGRSVEARYRLAMLITHDLAPARYRIPTTVRGFLGQVAVEGEGSILDVLRWRDHVNAWTDADGLPVLTVEPNLPEYLANPHELRDDIAQVIDRYALPLTVEISEGVWSPRCVLAKLTYDPNARPLAAEYTGPVQPTSARRGRRVSEPQLYTTPSAGGVL